VGLGTLIMKKVLIAFLLTSFFPITVYALEDYTQAIGQAESNAGGAGKVAVKYML